MVTEPVHEETRLPVWQAYCDHAKLQAKSCNDTTMQNNGGFSLILGSLQEERFELYSKYGFCQDVFDKLDALLFSIEENCLHKIIADFERYRLGTETGLLESSLSEPTDLHDSPKLSEPLPGKQAQTTSPLKTEQIESPYGENLGRGKRKKFLKLKFDFLEPKFKSIHQAEQSEKSSDDSCGAVIEQKSSQISTASVDATKPSPASAKPSSKRLSTASNTSLSLTKPAKRKRAENKQNFIDESFKNDALNSLISIEDKVKNDKVVLKSADNIDKHKDIKRKGNSKSNRKKNFPDDTGFKEALMKSKNLKLDGSDGKVVCCLGDRIDAKPLQGLNTENIQQETLKAPGETDTEQNSKLSESQPKAKKIKQKVKKERPPGERYNLECDKLAPMMCAVCRKTFPTLPELSAHWRQKHRDSEQTLGGKTYMCPKCEKTFTTSHSYKLHHRIHVGAKPHVCSDCNRPFRTYKCLLDHMTVHNREHTVPCPTCMKMFGSVRLMKQHLKRHSERPRPFTCEICGKAFPRRPSLLIHLSSVHRKERPHKCPHCDIAFNQKSSLTTHMRLHTGDKRHICDVCGCRFNTNVALITHRRRHTGEKPYACDICDFRASSSSSLNDHKSTHRNEKPYLCQVPNCNRGFKRRSHLISHHRTHVGVWPYHCQTCGAGFNLTSELQKHLRANTCKGDNIINVKVEVPAFQISTASTIPEESAAMETQQDGALIKLENRDLEEDLPIADFVGSEERPMELDSLANLPENSVVIEIIREPGRENPDELVLSKEEMEAIVRISQQL